MSNSFKDKAKYFRNQHLRQQDRAQETLARVPQAVKAVIEKLQYDDNATKTRRKLSSRGKALLQQEMNEGQ